MRLTLLDAAAIGIPLLLLSVVVAKLRKYVRGVADFLAAGRGAGRYLMATSAGEMSGGVITTVSALEVFSQTGLSLQVFSNLTVIVWLFISISGFVNYRFRETRVLTFHQFLEARYSRRLRIFATLLTFFSGLFSFGLIPGVTARFFVHLLGFPEELNLGFGVVPTFVPVMLAVVGLVLLFTLSSGQIGSMLTDSLEYVLSLVFYIVIAACILGLFAKPVVTVTEMKEAMLSGKPGASFVNPFDVSARADFNLWFVVLGLLTAVYGYRGNTTVGVSAENAHESRMAGVLGSWRSIGMASMGLLVGISAFTLMHHPHYEGVQSAVASELASLPTEQLRTQMRMPTAIGHALPSGVRGCFAAIMLFATIASLSANYMQMGTAFVQDLIIPSRGGRTPEPRKQVRWLRLSVLAFGLWTCVFSTFFKPADYLALLTALISAIYMAGVGVVILGGLYWSRGTTAAAWTSMIMGAALASLAWAVQSFWTDLCPTLLSLTSGSLHQYLAAHTDKIPLNGLVLSVCIAGLCTLSYIAVSLLTCTAPHNMDRLLHRGPYRVDDETAPVSATHRSLFSRILNIDHWYTPTDKLITFSVLFYTWTWSLLAIGILAWNLLIRRWSDEMWWHYLFTQYVVAAVAVFCVTAAWFIWGCSIDITRLIRKLETARRDASDNGQLSASPSAPGPLEPTSTETTTAPAQSTARAL